MFKLKIVVTFRVSTNVVDCVNICPGGGGGGALILGWKFQRGGGRGRAGLIVSR